MEASKNCLTTEMERMQSSCLVSVCAQVGWGSEGTNCLPDRNGMLWKQMLPRGGVVESSGAPLYPQDGRMRGWKQVLVLLLLCAAPELGPRTFPGAAIGAVHINLLSSQGKGTASSWSYCGST